MVNGARTAKDPAASKGLKQRIGPGGLSHNAMLLCCVEIQSVIWICMAARLLKTAIMACRHNQAAGAAWTGSFYVMRDITHEETILR